MVAEMHGRISAMDAPRAGCVRACMHTTVAADVMDDVAMAASGRAGVKPTAPGGACTGESRYEVNFIAAMGGGWHLAVVMPGPGRLCLRHTLCREYWFLVVLGCPYPLH